MYSPLFFISWFLLCALDVEPSGSLYYSHRKDDSMFMVERFINKSGIIRLINTVPTFSSLLYCQFLYFGISFQFFFLLCYFCIWFSLLFFLTFSLFDENHVNVKIFEINRNTVEHRKILCSMNIGVLYGLYLCLIYRHKDLIPIFFIFNSLCRTM